MKNCSLTKRLLKSMLKLEILMKENNLTPEQIYNVDKTGLFWHSISWNTLTAANERSVCGMKAAKERVTVFVCANADGTHKCTLLVVGKSAHPHALKGVKMLSMI